LILFSRKGAKGVELLTQQIRKWRRKCCFALLLFFKHKVQETAKKKVLSEDAKFVKWRVYKVHFAVLKARVIVFSLMECI